MAGGTGTGRVPSCANGDHLPTTCRRNGLAGVDFHASPLKEPFSEAIVNWPRSLQPSAAGPKSSSVASSSSPFL